MTQGFKWSEGQVEKKAYWNVLLYIDFCCEVNGFWLDFLDKIGFQVLCSHFIAIVIHTTGPVTCNHPF